MQEQNTNRFSALGWWMYLNRASINESTFIKLWKTGDSQAVQNYLVNCGKKEKLLQSEWIKKQLQAIKEIDEQFSNDLKGVFTLLIEHWSKQGKQEVKERLTEYTELIKHYNLQSHVKELYRKVG